MSNKSLTKAGEVMPSVFDDFFKPWNEWLGNGGLWGKALTVPAVNISENKDDYKVTMAAPGLKKSDFKIDVAQWQQLLDMQAQLAEYLRKVGEPESQ